MKKFLARFAVSVVFFAVSSQTVNAQWIQTSGPTGGSVSALAVSGSNIFAGTWGGVVWRRPLSEQRSHMDRFPVSLTAIAHVFSIYKIKQGRGRG